MAILSAFILPHPPILLPEVGQQIAIARQKASIRSDEDYTLERFEGVRHL